MTYKQVHKRYMKIFVPSMIAYVLGGFAVAYLRKHTGVSVQTLVVLALIPGCAMVVWFWGLWRFINELDEFLQKLHLQASMIGLATIMSVASVWGVLEEFVKTPSIPALPVFYIIPIFCAVYGLSVFAINKRAGVKGACL